MKLNSLLYVLTALSVLSTQASASPLDKLSLPCGFKIDYYAQGVDSARQLAVDEYGVVYVGSRKKEGKVYALLPNKNNTQAKKTITLINGLNYPNGVAFHKGKLYVAELDKVGIYKITRKAGELAATKVGEVGQFSNKAWYGFKYVKFSPAGELYTAVGMPCNTCFYRDSQPIFGTIVKLDGKGKVETVAKGVRNSVGFDWQSTTQSLWFTDNGQDMLGDDTPPDELNLFGFNVG